MMNRCALYTRCSTSDQTTFNQLRELKAIATRKRLTVVAEFEDASVSGAKGRDQGVGIRKIATDLKVGVCTVYKVLEAA